MDDSAEQTPITVVELDEMARIVVHGGAITRRGLALIAAARLGITNSGVIDDALATALGGAMAEIESLKRYAEAHRRAHEQVGDVEQETATRTAKRIADWLIGVADEMASRSPDGEKSILYAPPVLREVAGHIRDSNWVKP